MTGNTPRVAICVVTYNSAELIRDLVASLADGAVGTQWQLVIADNGSVDGTLAELARWAPSATVVENGANLGYSGGINAAVAAAGEQDAYLILNADVRLEPGCVLTLFGSLGPRVGIAVPRLEDATGGLIWSRRRKPSVLRAWGDALLGAERAGRVSLLGEVVTDRRLYMNAGPTDWAEGSTQLISADCWRICGPWDESYFLYSEETEFDLRAGDRGLHTWYQPAARATHLEGGSASSSALWELVVANRVLLFSRRHGPGRTFLFWLAIVARESSRALIGKSTSRLALRTLLSPSRLRAPRGAHWLRR